jgi:hypothetical protein
MSIKVCHASFWLCSAIVPPSQRSILAHQILVLVSAHSTTDDMHHKETLDEIGPDLCTDTNMRITFHGKADLAT